MKKPNSVMAGARHSDDKIGRLASAVAVDDLKLDGIDPLDPFSRNATRSPLEHLLPLIEKNPAQFWTNFGVTSEPQPDRVAIPGATLTGSYRLPRRTAK